MRINEDLKEAHKPNTTKSKEQTNSYDPMDIHKIEQNLETLMKTDEKRKTLIGT